MARPTSPSLLVRLRRHARAYRWQRVGVLAAISLLLGLLLVCYLFGWSDGFLRRLLTAAFVNFSLLTVTFLGILPFIGWATTHWFGAAWATGIDSAPARRPAPRPTNSRSFTS